MLAGWGGHDETTQAPKQQSAKKSLEKCSRCKTASRLHDQQHTGWGKKRKEHHGTKYKRSIMKQNKPSNKTDFFFLKRKFGKQAAVQMRLSTKPCISFFTGLFLPKIQYADTAAGRPVKTKIGVLVHFRLSPLWSSDKMASKKSSKSTSSCSSWICFRGGAGTGCLKQASTTLQAESQSHFHGKLTKPMKRCLSFPTWPRWTIQFSVLHEKKWQTLRRRRKSRNEAACRMVAGRRARLHRITDHEKQLGSSMVTLVNNAYEQSH